MGAAALYHAAGAGACTQGAELALRTPPPPPALTALTSVWFPRPPWSAPGPAGCSPATSRPPPRVRDANVGLTLSLWRRKGETAKDDGACPPGPDSGVGGDGRAEERESDWKWETGRGLSGRGHTSDREEAEG